MSDLVCKGSKLAISKRYSEHLAKESEIGSIGINPSEPRLRVVAYPEYDFTTVTWETLT